MARPSFVNDLQGIANPSSSGSQERVQQRVQERVETQVGSDTPLNGGFSGGVPNTMQYNDNVIDNNMHPLFLHNNDHPGLFLISKKFLGPDNYTPWS